MLFNLELDQVRKLIKDHMAWIVLFGDFIIGQKIHFLLKFSIQFIKFERKSFSKTQSLFSNKT
jgi:hypothetical protein